MSSGRTSKRNANGNMTAGALEERLLSNPNNQQSSYGTWDSEPHEHEQLWRRLVSPSSQKYEDLTTAEWLKYWMTSEVSTAWADLILLVCFFISGLVDSGAYNAYECFVSMQTGNTVFAALGVSDLPIASPRLAWTKSLCAIVSFLVGAAFFGNMHRIFSPRKRWVLILSFSIQTALVLGASMLVHFGKSSDSPAKKPSSTATLPDDPGFPWMDLLPIALLSFQAPGKVVASRALQYNAMPAVVLTTLYNDLMADPSLLTAGLFENVQRNRRVAGIFLYFGGAVIGGVLATSSFGFAGALWLAAAVKVLIVVAWVFWKEKADDEED